MAVTSAEVISVGVGESQKGKQIKNGDVSLPEILSRGETALTREDVARRRGFFYKMKDVWKDSV